MKINYNVTAMLSNNALANNDDLLSASLQRLSSGLKINRAKDNPAGLAMAKRMNAQIVGLDVANQNASDGVSIIEVADGAMAEITDMIQRINELTVKASNGTSTDDDRALIQNEVSQLKEEIERVKNTTQFNGQNLLNGEFQRKGYIDTDGIKVNRVSMETPADTYVIDSLVLDDELDEDGNPTGYKTLTSYTLSTELDEKVTSVELKDDILTLKGRDGFELKIDLTDVAAGTINNLEVEVADLGPMRLQIGANEGQVLEVDIPALSLRNMGIERIDVSTLEGAKDALSRMGGALSFVSGVRGKLGAYQNRLESTVRSLDVTSENMTAAYSRIMDVDMAEEMTKYTTYQVLTQAGTSMLAQANERPSQVLQLLQ